MKNILIICLFLIITNLVSAQTIGSTTTPYDTLGWDEPAELTEHYGLYIYQLLSNPGGRININTAKIDSLLNALIVYTRDPLYIENDTLKLRIAAHGEIYALPGDAVTVACATANNYYKVTGITSDHNNQTTGDGALGTITITKTAHYFISFALSVSANTNNFIAHGDVFINDVEIDKIGFRRRLNTGTDVGAVSGQGLYALTAGDVVDFRISASVNSVTYSIEHFNLTVQEIH